MRRILIALLFVLAPNAAFASWAVLRFAPSSPCVRVGETAHVRMYVEVYPGFSNYPVAPWGRASAQSAAPEIAAASGWLQYPDTYTNVDVTGISPGLVEIVGRASGLPLPASTSFEVYEPITAAPQQLSAQLRAPITLTAPWKPQPYRVTVWYEGELHDTSRPLGAGAQLPFTPQAYGTHHVWARSIGTCFIDTAQFEIEVPLPKRRAVH